MVHIGQKKRYDKYFANLLEEFHLFACNLPYNLNSMDSSVGLYKARTFKNCSQPLVCQQWKLCAVKTVQ